MTSAGWKKTGLLRAWDPVGQKVARMANTRCLLFPNPVDYMYTIEIVRKVKRASTHFMMSFLMMRA